MANEAAACRAAQGLGPAHLRLVPGGAGRRQPVFALHRHPPRRKQRPARGLAGRRPGPCRAGHRRPAGLSERKAGSCVRCFADRPDPLLPGGGRVCGGGRAAGIRRSVRPIRAGLSGQGLPAVHRRSAGGIQLSEPAQGRAGHGGGLSPVSGGRAGQGKAALRHFHLQHRQKRLRPGQHRQDRRGVCGHGKRIHSVCPPEGPVHRAGLPVHRPDSAGGHAAGGKPFAAPGAGQRHAEPGAQYARRAAAHRAGKAGRAGGESFGGAFAVVRREPCLLRAHLWSRAAGAQHPERARPDALHHADHSGAVSGAVFAGQVGRGLCDGPLGDAGRPVGPPGLCGLVRRAGPARRPVAHPAGHSRHQPPERGEVRESRKHFAHQRAFGQLPEPLLVRFPGQPAAGGMAGGDFVRQSFGGRLLPALLPGAAAGGPGLRGAAAESGQNQSHHRAAAGGPQAVFALRRGGGAAGLRRVPNLADRDHRELHRRGGNLLRLVHEAAGRALHRGHPPEAAGAERRVRAHPPAGRGPGRGGNH